MVPIVSVVGRTDSGKTTLIERLIPALGQYGCRVATIKHHHHGDFEADHPGKDSWRHARAGAVATALAGSQRLAVFQKVEGRLSPELIAGLFVQRPDLVLTEGFKEAPFPKIEVVRAARGGEPLCGPSDGLVALVTDCPLDLGVPRFGLDEIEPLARFVVERLLGRSPAAG